MADVFIRFETPNDTIQADIREVVMGPFPFVQMTYSAIRVGPDGAIVGYHYQHSDMWELSVGPNAGKEFSDVVIYSNA